MHSPRRPHAHAWAFILAAWLGLSALAVPSATLADSGLVAGGEAVVAGADGRNVRVRADASVDSDIVAAVPEGTDVSLIEGPFDGSDGNSWYRVATAGVDGFIASDFLAGDAVTSSGGSDASVTATDNVHLRSGPGVGYLSIGKVPAGTAVTVLDSMDGWLRVEWNGFQGWIYAEFFTDGGAEASAPSDAPPTDDAPETGQTEPGTRWTDDSVNFRTGPSQESRVIELLPGGITVELTGTTQDGFAEVTVDGVTGWVSLDFLTTSAPGEPEPEFEQIDAGTRYTTERVNLRSAPTMDGDVLEVLVPGTAIELTGRASDGYAEATVDGTTGWVSRDYLGMEPPVDPDEDLSDEPEAEEPAEAPAEEPQEEPAAPSDGSSTIIWPVSGGEWYIGQGYNGSSHQNNGSLWQYQYSFDLARTDEQTGGQPVYAPVSGTVRWLDPSTGGISIDAGGGLAVALFHVDIDASVTEGDTLTQGEYIGVASYPGGGGNGGWAHVHLTAWRTSDGGNWDRQAIPFTGIAAISGREFPNSGVSQDWTGTVIYP